MADEGRVRRRRTRPGGTRRSPALTAAPAAVGRAAGPGARGAPLIRPLRVLVVDDCRDTTDSTTELVGLWGHDARRAYAGAEALEAAAEYPPDGLLVDLALPAGGGGGGGRPGPPRARPRGGPPVPPPPPHGPPAPP